MKFITEYINVLKSGWYSGKGFKASRIGKYKKALNCYELALKYSENDFDPVIYDSMAIAFYKLDKPKEALLNAKKSLEQYSTIENKSSKAIERINILKQLIETLKQ